MQREAESKAAGTRHPGGLVPQPAMCPGTGDPGRQVGARARSGTHAHTHTLPQAGHELGVPGARALTKGQNRWLRANPQRPVSPTLSRDIKPRLPTSAIQGEGHPLPSPRPAPGMAQASACLPIPCQRGSSRRVSDTLGA